MEMEDRLAGAPTGAAEDLPDGGLALRLPAVLDLKAAAPLAADFVGRRGADIVVDAAAVQRLGGQCLQVLLAARQSWAADARAMTIANASPEFRSATELFGAGPALFSDQKEPA